MYDHRGVLRAVRVSPGAFLRDCGLIFDEAAARIFDAAPAAGSIEAKVVRRQEG